MAVGRSLVPETTYRALNEWDESINAAVSANLMRDPMRPSVRLNSWSDHYEGWSNGPRWQHIPPLFAYVPLPFFWIEGKPTIEMKRLSYFLLSALTGLLFIGMIQKARPRELESISAAAMAAGLWMLSPFTQGLVTGREFGTSDLVLAAAMVGAFAEILTLRQMRDEGRIPSGSHLVRAALVCSIPWVVKSWLGSIPLAHLAWLTWSWKALPRGSKARCLLAALLLPFLHTVWMVSISPETFLAEIGDPFKHFVDNEGWGRPWYFHFVYLHRNYLGNRPWAHGPFRLGLSRGFQDGLDTPQNRHARETLGALRLLVRVQFAGRELHPVQIPELPLSVFSPRALFHPLRDRSRDSFDRPFPGWAPAVAGRFESVDHRILGGHPGPPRSRLVQGVPAGPTLPRFSC